MKTFLLAILLTFSCSLTGCAVLKDKAKAVAVQETGDLIAKKLPVEKRDEFLRRYNDDVGDGIKFAAETIGVDKLADTLEELDSENKRLADEIRAGGADAAKRLWAEIVGAFVLAGLSHVAGRKKGASLPKKLLRVVISALGDPAPDVKERIKQQARAEGVKSHLDREVAKVKK